MEIIITSLIAFASTNIDDIFILILFYGNRKFRDREVTAGQFLGIAILIGISLVGSLIGILIAQSYIGLLGLIPIFFGAKGVWGLLKNTEDQDPAKPVETSQTKSNLLAVAGTTIANGGDNIGIYIPLFAVLSWPNKMTMAGIFLLMTFVWCAAAKYMVRHPYVAEKVEKYGHFVTPFVLVLLGIYILYENGSFQLIGATGIDFGLRS